MIIAIDAMGGDNAPKEIVLGAMKAVQAFDDIEIRLYGDEEKIRGYLQKETRISIIHTTEVIEADDEPVRAVRKKKDASMVVMAESVKKGEADACISAGNTGALMSAGLFIVGRIAGIDRPALAPTLPTIDGSGFMLLDVGANVDSKPENLLQYAIMGQVYAEQVRGIKQPTVGLLNIGTEEKKGNELSRNAYDLLKHSSINFVGNVEARDLFNHVADVVVCDAFSGNIALKTIEGTAFSVMSMLKAELLSSFKSKLAAAVLKPQLLEVRKKLDYSEYGGANLFGLKAPVIKAHGSSDATAIYNAVRQAREIVKNEVPQTIQKYIELESTNT